MENIYEVQTKNNRKSLLIIISFISVIASFPIQFNKLLKSSKVTTKLKFYNYLKIQIKILTSKNNRPG